MTEMLVYNKVEFVFDCLIFLFQRFSKDIIGKKNTNTVCQEVIVDHRPLKDHVSMQNIKLPNQCGSSIALANS